MEHYNLTSNAQDLSADAVLNMLGSTVSDENLQVNKRNGKGDEKQPNQVDNEMKYPQGMKLGLIILSLCVSVFLVALVTHSRPLTLGQFADNS